MDIRAFMAMQMRKHVEHLDGPLRRLRDDLTQIQGRGANPDLDNYRHCDVAWNLVHVIDALLDTVANLAENLEADDDD